MKTYLITILAGFMSLGAFAQNVERVGVSNIVVEKTDNGQMIVSMQVNPKETSVKYNQQLEITPIVVSTDKSKTQSLEPIVIAGKNAYYYTTRNDESEKYVYKAGKNAVYDYTDSTPFQNWMNNSVLAFDIKTTGCCGSNSNDREILPVADLNYLAPQFNPTFDYIEPTAVASKLFNLEGRAYISFIVNKTNIDPNYMNNPEELKKILSTIDAVKDNKDAKVRLIKLTGYASPEGPYANNVRLAEGRTVALKEYVRQQYAFPENLFQTSSVPEDWEGLKAAVEKSGLADAGAIVDFINSDYPIEQRNERLRALFPQTYPFLLKNIYPGLRHTDYVITYEVRKYTDVNEIKQVLKTRPQNLSLNEFFLAAQTYEPGSPEFDEVFDVAVRMYPDDPTANINAASASISRGDLDSAAKFLQRVGDNPKAEYVKGILDAKRGNYDSALIHFKKSNDPKAKDAINQINNIRNYKGAVTFK